MYNLENDIEIKYNTKYLPLEYKSKRAITK